MIFDKNTKRGFKGVPDRTLFYKKTVIKWRTSDNVKIGNLLARVVEAYEKSRVTIDYVTKYYNELKFMEK